MGEGCDGVGNQRRRQKMGTSSLGFVAQIGVSGLSLTWCFADNWWSIKSCWTEQNGLAFWGSDSRSRKGPSSNWERLYRDRMRRKQWFPIWLTSPLRTQRTSVFLSNNYFNQSPNFPKFAWLFWKSPAITGITKVYLWEKAMFWANKHTLMWKRSNTAFVTKAKKQYGENVTHENAQNAERAGEDEVGSGGAGCSLGGRPPSRLCVMGSFPQTLHPHLVLANL